MDKTDKTLSVSLVSIQIDTALQPRIAGLDSSHVTELQQVPEGWPPLVVVSRVHIPGQSEQGFRFNLNTDSETM